MRPALAFTPLLVSSRPATGDRGGPLPFRRLERKTPEQLSGTDALFVAMESSRVHAHTGGLTILGRLDRCSSGERGKVRVRTC